MRAEHAHGFIINGNVCILDQLDDREFSDFSFFLWMVSVAENRIGNFMFFICDSFIYVMVEEW